MQIVRVGGVPEHFNLAWHLAIENNWFAERGIAIEFIDVPGGTGAMSQMLRNNEIDIAIALTEGIVADILDGNPSKIVQFFVNSPLRWGVFTSENQSNINLKNIKGLKFAISRFKSGSHLMAKVYANEKKHVLDESKSFVLVENIDGARTALKNKNAQLFLWEKYTTQPLVESGELLLLDECKTPWPCFVLAANNKFIADEIATLKQVLDIINFSCHQLKENKRAVSLISKRYSISKKDAEKWFSELEYSESYEMKEKQWFEILDQLFEFKIISEIPKLNQICLINNLVRN